MMRFIWIISIIGCVVKSAFAAGENNTEQCGENQILDPCVNRVREYRSCSEVGGIIEAQIIDQKFCKKGCKCIETHLKADNGTCIPATQCPNALKCPKDYEYYDACPSLCPSRICGVKDNATCPVPLLPGNPACPPPACRCNTGFFRNKKGDCVPSLLCPKPVVCGDDEVHTTCVNGGCGRWNCSQTAEVCNNITESDCKDGCHCKEGFLRADNGTCIAADMCPVKCDGENEISGCASNCLETCESIDNTNSCEQPIVCKPKCRCKEGFLRNKDGKCISKEECPKLPGVVCGTNEVYNSCVNSGCEKQHCSQPDDMLCINPLPEEYEEGCLCDSGLLRSDNGTCVPANQCSNYNTGNGLKGFEKSNVALALKTNYIVAKATPGVSYAFSSISTLLLLAQLALHASGKSSEQLLKLLNVQNKHKLWSLVPHYLDALSSQNEVIYNRAEKIFANDQYKFSTSFSKVTKDIFKSEAINFNYTSNNNAMSASINSWATVNASDPITNLVSPSSFDKETALILVSSVYFKGTWLDPFDPGYTKQKSFYVNNNKTVNVNMMKRTGTYKYADIGYLDAQVIDIPYEGKKFSLMVWLPKNKDGMDSLLDKIRSYDSSSLWRSVLNSLSDKELDISIPAFEIKTTIGLKNSLKKANVTEIFNSTGASGLSGIFQDPRKAYVSHARQHTTLVVNESGTRAGVLTTILRPVLSLLSLGENTKFNANHQFIYFVLHSSIPILSGVYAGN